MGTNGMKRQIPGSLALLTPNSENKLNAMNVKVKSIIPSLVMLERDVNQRLQLNECVKKGKPDNRADKEGIKDQENGLSEKIQVGIVPNSSRKFKLKNHKRNLYGPEIKKQSIYIPRQTERRKRFVNADIVPFDCPLAKNGRPLLIKSCARHPVSCAAPFFNFPEFDPASATDEMILVEILNFEMDHIDKGMQKVRTAKEILKFKMYELLHFGQICIEDYLARFPWDQFYSPELYAEAMKRQPEQGIGFGCKSEHVDILAGIKPERATSSMPKTEYAFVPKQ